MLRIQVTSSDNQPVSEPLAAEFDEMGGSIGRSEGNTLILPDEKRYISRTQAAVIFQSGGYYLRDHGSATPTFVNNNPVGHGNEVPLRDGDALRIGEYVLSVSAPAAMADPFADLMPSAPAKPAAAATGAAPAGDPFADLMPSAPASPTAPATGAAAIGDPFADLMPGAPPSPTAPAVGAAAIGDPFADLMPSSPAKPTAPAAAPAKHSPQASDDPFAIKSPTSPSSGAGVIPHDFDPFADLQPQAAPAQMPASDGLNLMPSNETVDDLFGLKSASAWDPLGPNESLGGTGSMMGGSNIDPFADLTPPSSRGAQAPAHQRDDAPILSGAFTPPRALEEQVKIARAAAPMQPTRPLPPRAAPPAPKPADMVVSWDTSSAPAAGGEIKTVILPSPRRAQPPQAPRVEDRAAALPVAPKAPPVAAPPSPPVAAPPAAPPRAAPAAAPVSSAPPVSAAQRDELLHAFLTGTGMPELEITGGLTPEFMNLLGQLVRESMSGTLDLLLARALTKREVRAHATVIVAKENNPLKFSPNVEAALTNLLATQGRGFMSPVTAMRDAYNDLRSHQFGFMAGMRAALAGVLARFDPSHLEQRLSQKGLLSSILPSNRRAKLWELYEQLYRDISKEAEDDFQTLFGKEFLRAYEAQIDKLEQEDAAAKR